MKKGNRKSDKSTIGKTKSTAKPKGKPASKKKASSYAGEDVIELILRDHKPLKKMIKVLKSEDVEMEDKEPVFEMFAPMLLAHAEPEEESLYVHMKNEEELRVESYEGDTEHTIASNLIDEIYATEEPDAWMAKVKVLAELVEHHIEEEEDEMLPDVKKQMEIETRRMIGREYLRLREGFDAKDTAGFERTSYRPSPLTDASELSQ